MKILTRVIALLLLSTVAHSDGIYNPLTENAVGMDGIYNVGASGGGGVTPCSGTGLDFTSACNSQYIGLL